MRHTATVLILVATLVACQYAAPASPSLPPSQTAGATSSSSSPSPSAPPAPIQPPSTPDATLTPTQQPTEVPASASPSATAAPQGEGLIVEWRAVRDPGLGSVGRIVSSAAAGSRMVIVGEAGEDYLPAIWTSGDGRRWQAANFADADSIDLRFVEVVAGGPGFVAPAVLFEFGMVTRTNSHIYTSEDGRSWSRNDPLEWSGVEIDAIVSAPDAMTAFGVDAAGLMGAWSSSDGTNWLRLGGSAAALGGRLLDARGTAEGMYALSRAAGRQSPEIEVWLSADGVDWSRVGALPDSANAESAWLASGPAGWAAVASLATRRATEWRAWHSIDGRSWQTATNSPTHVADIFADAAGFIAAGYFYRGAGCALDETSAHAVTWTSVDGIEWRQMPDEGWAGRQIDQLRRFNRTLIGIGLDWTRDEQDPYANNGAVWTAELPDLATDTSQPPAPTEPIPSSGC